MVSFLFILHRKIHNQCWKHGHARLHSRIVSHCNPKCWSRSVQCGRWCCFDNCSIFIPFGLLKFGFQSFSRFFPIWIFLFSLANRPKFSHTCWCYWWHRSAFWEVLSYCFYQNRCQVKRWNVAQMHLSTVAMNSTKNGNFLFFQIFPQKILEIDTLCFSAYVFSA